MKQLMVGVALALGGGAIVAIAETASALEPAKQGCLGASVSANAKALHPYGQVVLAPNAPRSEFGSIGDAVHAVQAGQVDDSIFPNICN